jgi:hypothetical protein
MKHMCGTARQEKEEISSQIDLSYTCSKCFQEVLDHIESLKILLQGEAPPVFQETFYSKIVGKRERGIVDARWCPWWSQEIVQGEKEETEAPKSDPASSTGKEESEEIPKRSTGYKYKTTTTTTEAGGPNCPQIAKEEGPQGQVSNKSARLWHYGKKQKKCTSF